MTSRRHLLEALGAAMLAQPLALFAQQPKKIRRIGFLFDGTRPDQPEAGNIGAFRQGMRELGYIEGENLVIEWRFAEGKPERLPDLATELVRANVEVLVSVSTPTTRALQKATSTIPIVATTIPVGSGYIKSLARPGGNITGLSNMILELRGKQLEMLRSVTSKLTRMAALYNPDNSANFEGLSILQVAAKKFVIEVASFDVRTPQRIEDAFALMARNSIQAILVLQGTIVQQHRRQIAEAALKLRLPTIAPTAPFAEAGLLMSYGPNFPDIYRRAATLRRQDPQRREPGRFAGRAADAIRPGREHEDGESARPQDAGRDHGARRAAHRVIAGSAVDLVTGTQRFQSSSLPAHRA